MVDNCVECSKVGITTECQYMEFPEGMHHYFDEKVCSFHHWFLYVRPRKGWENYLGFAQAEAAAAGYHLTLPPDEVIEAIIRGKVSTVGPAPGAQTTVPSEAAQGQSPSSSDDQAAVQQNPSQS